MKLTIKTTEVEAALKAVFPRVPGKKAALTITAIDGNVILESGNNAGAANVEVERPGQVTLPTKTFRKVLDTYAGVPDLSIEADASGVRINAFKMPVTNWTASPARPAGF